MTSNTFGNIFNFTTWGESHGNAIGCVVDGVPSKRIVLGDWYELDSVLIYDENGFRFERVANYINNN